MCTGMETSGKHHITSFVRDGQANIQARELESFKP
jgi:hypothetical protein